MKREFDPLVEINNITNWIKDYFIKNGPTAKAIIGISGGKDSAIAAALLVRALGSDRVIGVLLPEGHQKDIDDAYEICKILKIEHYEINIGPIMTRFENTFPFRMNPTIITNTPSRIRMAMLYAVASNFHGRVVNTCNASEDFVGYSTKYGDLAGDFSLFKNYTVREVLAIGDFLSNIPERLVHKIPNDGMCGKSDEENLNFSYDTLDSYLIDNVYPSYEIISNIKSRHERNKHKFIAINLPAPTNCTGHHDCIEWQQDRMYHF